MRASLLARLAQTTAYRSWDTKAALVGEAVGEPLALGASFDTANIRDELVQTVRVTMRNDSGTFAAEVLPVLAATRARDAELIEAFRTKFLRARRRRTTEAFERAVARGELPEDVDEALLQDILGGAIFYRTLVSGESFTEDIVERMVDALVSGEVPRLSTQEEGPASGDGAGREEEEQEAT